MLCGQYLVNIRLFFWWSIFDKTPVAALNNSSSGENCGQTQTQKLSSSWKKLVSALALRFSCKQLLMPAGETNIRPYTGHLVLKYTVLALNCPAPEMCKISCFLKHAGLLLPKNDPDQLMPYSSSQAPKTYSRLQGTHTAKLKAPPRIMNLWQERASALRILNE